MTSVLPFTVAVFGALYLLLTGYRILYYRASGYELTDKEIKCNRGVLFRKRSVLDYNRIHAINKKQNLIQRIFGIAVLTVDSGSANTSHQAEITVIEREAVVDSLLDRLNSLKAGGIEAKAEKEKKEKLLLSEGDDLYSFTSGKKVLYTLINIISTAFLTLTLAVFAIAVLSACKGVVRLGFLGSWGEYFIYAVLITVGATLLFSLFSLIGSIIHSFVGYYGFTVARRDNNLCISYGLFEKHTNTFSYDRIKAVKITQGLVQRFLGFATIRLEVIGYTVGGGDENKNTGIGVLIPFCRYCEIGEILDRVLPDYKPDEKQTCSVSLFSFMSWFLLIFGICAIASLAVVVAIMAVLRLAPPSVILAVSIALASLALAVVALKFVSASLSYRTSGIAVEGDRITAYSGGFTRSITVFKAKNLVAVEDVTTPLRKKRGISSVIMHLKTNAQSNEVKIHIQKDTLPDRLDKMLTL